MTSHHDRLVEALNLWTSLTTQGESRRIGDIRQYDIKQMSESIREGLELDEKNITGFLLLGNYARILFKNTHFTVAQMLEDPEQTADFVQRASKLQSIVSDPEMLEDLRHFQLITRQAVRHYQADTDEVMKLIETDEDMGYLRRDALRSMKNLRVDYFLAGESEPEGTRPRYNRDVFQFWNINSLLQCVCNSPSGVSLNLVRTPDDFQSYFVFAIRNGGNVITLSDVPLQDHPLQNHLLRGRRQDKQFAERAYQNWFPYHLTNVKYDEEQGRIYFEHKDSQGGIVPLNQQAFPLTALKDLKPYEVIWITLMFELIVERFWRKPVQPEQLSYTGDMVRIQTSLIEQAKSSGLPVVQYDDINLPSLTVQEVAEPQGDQLDALGKNGGNHNQWMIDRYKHQVHEASMNMLSTGESITYITDQNEDAPKPLKAKDRQRIENSIVVRERHYPIRHLDSASFGTRAQLAADRVFIARHNLAQEIQRLADREFDARKEEVLVWFRERIEANLDRLLSLAIKGRAWGQSKDKTPNQEFTARREFKAPDGSHFYQIAELLTHEQWHKECYYLEASTFLNNGWNTAGHPYCYLNDTRSTYILGVCPQTKEDLAFLTNTPVDQLPDILQHWHVKTDNTHNHLLSRVDPIAWALSNPWENNGLFNVKVALSIRALKEITKTYPSPEVFGYIVDDEYPKSTDPLNQTLPIQGPSAKHEGR